MIILRECLEAATRAEIKVNSTLRLIQASTIKVLHAQGIVSPTAAASVADERSAKSKSVFLISHAKKTLQMYDSSTPD